MVRSPRHDELENLDGVNSPHMLNDHPPVIPLLGGVARSAGVVSSLEGWRAAPGWSSKEGNDYFRFAPAPPVPVVE
ncbi:MAG: hypothetical protein FWF06_06400 [Symbiobacteriaceae bacterium]|nr:hypothetical protein [Symbiobacteriaceae bacterium]